MTTFTRTLVSEQEFLQLPESMDRIELLDGEVIVSPALTPWHQQLVLRIGVALHGWLQGREPEWFLGQAPIDIRFAPGRILQPDLFLVCAAIPLDRGPVERVPELCVEVLSGNRVYDRVTKRFVYAAAGVQELWLVEPTGLVERRSGADLESVEELRDTLVSPLLPGFALDLRELFRGAPR